MPSYPTLDYLPDLDPSRMKTAGTLTFQPYTLSTTVSWDNYAWYSESNQYAILRDTFKWTATKGATYDIFSSSYFDPYLIEVYDEFGNVVAVDEESSYDTYGTDYVWDFVAPYTGTYYVSAGWDQGSASSNWYVRIAIYEDVGTAAPVAPTYSLKAEKTSVNEGESVTFTLTTTGVPNGSALEYKITGVSASDVGGGSLIGSVTITNGIGSITLPVIADSTTEGSETITVNVLSGAAIASTLINDTSVATVTVQSSVAGTLGNDCFVPTGGNRYFGTAGSDTYVIGARTLSSAVTASITDTEGSNVIQLVDGTTLASSQFYADAAQLLLSSGASVQVLGASKFMYQVGANLLSGDASPLLTYAQFTNSLGAALPTGTTPTAGTAGFIVPSGFSQAAAPGAVAFSGTSTVVGTLGNDILVPAGGNSHLGGAGNDTYIVSPNVLAPLVTASVTDTEGSNAIQIVDGTVIASSSFLNDALQLVLSSGARVQILGASKFIYQVGANATIGDTAADLTFSQFGALLGASIPAAGGVAVSGTANFTVPVTGIAGFTLVELNSGAVTARTEAEAFVFEFKMVNGRATKVDGDVVITGFDVAKDKLVFEDVGSGVIMTEAQFRQFPGVAIAEDPFNGSTNILLDPDQGVSGGVTIAGILDGALNQIVVETLP